MRNYLEFQRFQVFERFGMCGKGYAFRKLLKKPMYGSQDVKELKKLLIAKGYTGISADNGNFLGSTEKAVKAFQADKGLQVDGKAGKQTIQALGGIWQG